jgi:hypothetical protein
MTKDQKNYIDITFDGGKPGKMVNIFFGSILIELPDGNKEWINESRLDHDWKKKQVFS